MSKMSQMNEKLVEWLFTTKAVKVCQGDNPFWYTSCTIGPYYVNTENLYGGPEKAGELLKSIDSLKHDKLGCTQGVLRQTAENYKASQVYKGLMDEMCSFIRTSVKIDDVDYISGGERRDWFFSVLAADILKKPHITLFKDLTAVLYEKGEAKAVQKLEGAKVLHIADIITEASSYTRAWIPAVKALGAELSYSVVVVDRLQGGAENLRSAGVESLAMTFINETLFEKAREMGYIDEMQYSLVMDYMKDPKGSMEEFLKNHPEFISRSLEGDERTRERVKMCLEKKIYNI